VRKANSNRDQLYIIFGKEKQEKFFAFIGIGFAVLLPNGVFLIFFIMYGKNMKIPKYLINKTEKMM
jgi:hypothetical protein